MQGMGDAEEGFVVLVHIPLGDGLVPYRNVYLVGCSTCEEAEASIKDLYPAEPNIRLLVSPLRRGDMKGLKMEPNEVRPWHEPETP
jgi:hypothetical protein